MPSPLQNITLQSPGVFGLNTQAKDDILDPKFATIANNCVIDRTGRLAARKGWSKINSTAATGTPTIDVVHSYVTDSNTEVLISTGGNKFWTGNTTLTDSTGSITVTGDDWQFQNTQGNVIGFQDSHEPVWWDGSGNFEYLVDQNDQWQATTAYVLGDIVVPTTRDGNFYECTTAGTSGGSDPTWNTTLGTTTSDGTVTWTAREIPQSNTVLYAFGRLWITDANGKSLFYSDLLIPYQFDTAGTGNVGSAGVIDFDTVWPGSNDEIISLAIHNNNLIVFCKKTIVIYGSADDVSNIALVDIIEDIGCIARDTVQDIGIDLIYLSSSGVRSLGRTVIQDNMPLSDLSLNVRDDLVATTNSETPALIRSVYNEIEGLYLLNFPTTGEVYSFDVRLFNKGQTIRTTVWNAINPFGMTTRKNGDLVFGMAGGFLAKYDTYLDDDQTYIIKYRSGWIDLGQGSREMIWKKLKAFIGSEFDIDTTGSWAFNFSNEETTQTQLITGAPVAEYNSSAASAAALGSTVAEYNIAEFGSSISNAIVQYQMSGVGTVVKIGLQAVVNDGNIAFNRFDLFFKQGKLH